MISLRLESTALDDRKPANGMPFMSVIVPVRNEALFIGHTLEQLLRQDYDPERFEVLVADGRSTDGTPEIVQEMQARHANLHLLDNPGRLSSAGRNVAIRAARGELLVVIDGHCDVDNFHYLQELADAFERSGADCIGRPQPLDVRQASPLQRAIAVARSSRLGHHPDSHIYSTAEQFVRPQSVAIAYRRVVLDRVGLFDERFDACEDVDFNHRVEQAGFRCFFTPRIRVLYYPRASLLGLFRQMVRYGRGRVRLLRKYPATFSVPGFVPGMFLLGVLMGPLAGWLWAPLGMVYKSVLGIYAAAVLLASLLGTMRANDIRLLPWLPLVFPTIHVGAGTGILMEFIVGTRTAASPSKLEKVSGARPESPPVARRAA